MRRVIQCKVELAERQHFTSTYGSQRKTCRESATELARQSVVLLKNDGLLPLNIGDYKRVAVIGPLADAPKEQLGCWSLDGDTEGSITPLAELKSRLGEQVEVLYARGAKNSFDTDESLVAKAAEVAAQADVVLMFVGEDAVLSGEARCRATLDLPGVQKKLVRAVTETGVPTALVFLSGRPLTIAEEVDVADAVMFAWHPGSMAGPAITDLLLGVVSPSGKLPVTFPRSVGQAPIYYNHSNTGRPSPSGYRPLFGSELADLPSDYQYRSHYLDEEQGPLFPFGYGLSYAQFEYSDIKTNRGSLQPHEALTISVTLANRSDVAAEEVVQLYVRDKVASIIRPVRELKAFRRVALQPGESQTVEFHLSAEQLAYCNHNGQRILEPGTFHAWVGGDSEADLKTTFQLLPLGDELAPARTAPIPTAANEESPVR